MYTRNEKIIPVHLEDEMQSSYIDYAMSVIVGRALPDVRDGLKPVHRRIIYAMDELGLEHTKSYKKSARIVGEVLGKYHPHGDVAVYDALVRMVQNFSLRYPLIEGQGNFGSVDGDAPAAMRYTEAKLAAITDELIKDIDKDTVKFVPNFDDSLNEPSVLPSRLPNLIINGSSGIAVGMATNIPPHNLGEVADAIASLIDEPACEIKDLMKIIKGPDFPTGGIICGRDGIRSAYTSGRGLIKIRAKAAVETQKQGKESIIISEIPYQVNKANLVEAIAGLVREKKIEGISDLRDESDKDGMRVVIELKRDANAQVILNQLYKHSQLETTFGIIMLALVNNRPRVLNLKQILEAYVEHRKVIIIRRTNFELKKAQDRAHILEGLKIALENLDRIIKTIKKSKDPQTAKLELIKEFSLSDRQAQAILEMQLQRLTNLEREKIDREYLELIKKIEYYKSVLASEKKILGIIKEELTEIKKQYMDERRTEIVGEVAELELEDLIAEEDMVITISHSGYIKRIPVSAYKRQRRGGSGVTGADLKEEDFIEHLFIASTLEYILFFTDKGRVHWLKVHEIPQASRISKGKAIINVLGISQDEKVSAFVPVKEFKEGSFVVLATSLGSIKKTSLSAFSHPRKGGIIAITLEKANELIQAKLTDGTKEIILATKLGKVIRFKEAQVRNMGRGAKGVRGIRIDKKDRVIAMEVVRPDSSLLTVTSKGFGKRTKLLQYRLQSRGGKGTINIKLTSRNGEAVGLKTVTDKDEFMLITEGGMIVRCPVKDVKTTGRNSQGVHIMKIGEKDRISSVVRVIAEEEVEVEEADTQQKQPPVQGKKQVSEEIKNEEPTGKTQPIQKKAPPKKVKKNKAAKKQEKAGRGRPKKKK
jgi:DNA gyrase subunit A